ncbi:hypothetical protein [uncultured Gimesia sp.]|uniref:hypothetical protein n=1 Tax=uncultured Gimesia sp. TaxID=1678688 RepID=UPI00260EAF02|nr:hypothetical protein [uncultured Gimesia sp.]
MNRTLLLISLTMLSLIMNGEVPLVADDNIAQKTTKNIQGRWGSIWSNMDSCKMDKKQYFQFAGDQVHITFKEDVEPFKAQFKLIPSAESGNGGVNFRYPSIPDISKGLYVLKGDTLMLFIPDAGEPRPREISAYLKLDENIRFLVLVREKPTK